MRIRNEAGCAALVSLLDVCRLAAFGLGLDERRISTVDADGIALAAIQGLNAKVEAQQREIATLRNELAMLRRELSLEATRR